MHSPIPTFVLLFLVTACAAAPTAPDTGKAEAAVSAGSGRETTDPKPAADGNALRKELADKQRELGYAQAEGEVAALDRRMQTTATQAAVERAALERDEAERDLEVFVDQVRPRELEQRRIGLDRSMHRADHAKDELGELTAMYDADEFAKSTKELVLKRGRRELELAERDLAVDRREFEHFEKVEQPKRQRELARKLEDAQQAAAKAKVEAEKQQLEHALAQRKEADRLAKLRDEIAELQSKIAKVAP